MKKKKGKAHVTEKSWRDGREREVVNPVKREVKKKKLERKDERREGYTHDSKRPPCRPGCLK